MLTNGETTKIPLSTGTRQRCPLSQLLYLTSDERSKKYKKSEDTLSQGSPKTEKLLQI